MFIPDARPVFSMNMCGTAPSGLKPSATRRDIFQCNVIVIMLWVCYECVMDVLWLCYESVMNVLWKCYESVMKVSWKCYGCVMDVLWMLYCECVMDVLGMLWMHLGCVRDVLWQYAWRMNDGYFISTVWMYCKWFCNCDIVVVLGYNCYVNLCILFFRAFYMTK